MNILQREECRKLRTPKASVRQIGRQLRSLREKSAQTIAEVTRKTGISERTIRQLEAGKTNPSLATVVALADLYDVSLDDLTAARPDPVVADFTPASSSSETKRTLTRTLPVPRMTAHLIELEGSEVRAATVPSGPVFAHVLRGGLLVVLDGREVALGRGDSFHARAGALTAWRPRPGGGQVLVVEQTTEALPSVPQQEGQT